MKKIMLALVVVMLLVSVNAFALDMEGVYKFSTRTKAGQTDMAGWWGMMVIKGNTVSRVFHSPDGTIEKYYVGDLTQNGDIYSLKLTHAYKPDYVGNEHKNKITTTATTLSFTSPDGKFVETWTKK